MGRIKNSRPIPLILKPTFVLPPVDDRKEERENKRMGMNERAMETNNNNTKSKKDND